MRFDFAYVMTALGFAALACGLLTLAMATAADCVELARPHQSAASRYVLNHVCASGSVYQATRY